MSFRVTKGSQVKIGGVMYKSGQKLPDRDYSTLIAIGKVEGFKDEPKIEIKTVVERKKRRGRRKHN